VERIPSGIPGFDVLIEGGFPVGSNLLLIGEPMTGKSTMAMQFIYKGLTLGEAGIFISTNEMAENVRAKMASFGWDTTRFEKEGSMKYLDCYGLMIDSKLSDTPSIKRVPSALAFTSISVALSDLCSQFWKKQKSLRISFDSISSLLMYTNPEAVVRFLHVLLGRFKMVNAVSMLILEEGMHSKTVEITLQQLSDGVFKLVRRGEERLLTCLGLTATRCPATEIPLEMTKSGLRIKRE